MSISDEFYDDGKEEDRELFETIKDSLDKLVNEGLIEVCGIESSGEWRYMATSKGQQFIRDNKKFGDIEGFGELR